MVALQWERSCDRVRVGAVLCLTEKPARRKIDDEQSCCTGLQDGGWVNYRHTKKENDMKSLPSALLELQF